MSLTDLERIVEEMEALSASVGGVASINGFAARLRAWIADNREFIEACEQYAWSRNKYGALIPPEGDRDELAFDAAYRAREERKGGT